jgi:Zn-dependent peptidase ImmA (M78 family)
MSSPVERAAQAVRARLHLGTDEPLVNLLDAVEVGLGIPVVVASLGEQGLAGAYKQSRGEPFILVNGTNALVRCRFTLAHELGHHELGHRSSVDVGIDLASTDPAERDANAFAAELLLPLDALHLWLRTERSISLETVARLANDFQVSAQVARFRLAAAGKLSRRLINDLDRAIEAQEHHGMAARRGWRRRVDGMNAARRRQVRLPDEAERVFVTAWRKSLLDDEQLAARLHITVDEVSTMTAQLDTEL